MQFLTLQNHLCTSCIVTTGHLSCRLIVGPTCVAITLSLFCTSCVLFILTGSHTTFSIPAPTTNGKQNLLWCASFTAQIVILFHCLPKRWSNETVMPSASLEMSVCDDHNVLAVMLCKLYEHCPGTLWTNRLVVSVVCSPYELNHLRLPSIILS